MKTTTIRELRANMKSHFDKVGDDKDILLVPRQEGKESIIIMTLSEYNSLVETEYLLSTEANRTKLEQSIKELESGDVKELMLSED